MGLQKYGSPEPIEPEAAGQQKTAAQDDWTEADRQALADENQRSVERPETD